MSLELKQVGGDSYVALRLNDKEVVRVVTNRVFRGEDIKEIMAMLVDLYETFNDIEV